MLKNAFSLMQPFVSLIKHWIMQRNFLVNMFSLRPRLLTFYILAITARTTSFKKNQNSAFCTQYICVFCVDLGTQNSGPHSIQ